MRSIPEWKQRAVSSTPEDQVILTWCSCLVVWTSRATFPIWFSEGAESHIQPAKPPIETTKPPMQGKLRTGTVDELSHHLEEPSFIIRDLDFQVLRDAFPPSPAWLPDFFRCCAMHFLHPHGTFPHHPKPPPRTKPHGDRSMPRASRRSPCWTCAAAPVGSESKPFDSDPKCGASPKNDPKPPKTLPPRPPKLAIDPGFVWGMTWSSRQSGSVCPDFGSLGWEERSGVWRRRC